MRLISGIHAAELIGVSAPTFYKLVEEASDDSLLKPLSTPGGGKVWALENILEYLSNRDIEEAERRERLVAKWNEVQPTNAES